jgi:hypothetical protein
MNLKRDSVVNKFLLKVKILNVNYLKMTENSAIQLTYKKKTINKV